MVMSAPDLRATETGNWLAQLKKILQLGPEDSRNYGDNPKSEHRSTKKAVKVLLSNLRKGTSKTPDRNTTDDDQKFIVFNAVDQLIRDKVSKSDTKTKLEALAKFEEVLKQEFAAKANKKDAVGDNWQKMIGDAVQALRVEELDNIYKKDGQDALENELDKLLLNKDQDALEKVLENKNNNESPKLLEHCVRKMLKSDEGKKALESKSHVSGWALKAMRDPKLADDFLGSIHPLTFSGADFDEYAKSLGDKKDDILAKALLNLSKKDLPTDNTAKQKAKEQANGFAGMASAMDPAKFAVLAKKMLESDEGKKALVANTKLAGALFSSIDPAALKDFDFKAFGDAKDEILGEALLRLSQKTAMSKDGSGKPPSSLDPKLFTLLATKVDAKVWNAQTATTGVRKGMGARICMELWNAGGYEQVAELIKHGVDTSLPTRATEDVPANKEGLYSGFVEPTQHIISKYLRDIHANDTAKDIYEKLRDAVIPRIAALAPKNSTEGAGWKKELGAANGLASSGDYEGAHARLKKISDALVKAGASGVTSKEKQEQKDFEKLLKTLPKPATAPKSKIEGAKKIFAALEAKEKEDKEKNVESTLKTVTRWSDVQNSEWMKAFKEKPGTIWGFEDVRMPYVQAGHETDKGSRPLRMWEFWDALGVSRESYSELLKDPEKFAKKKVAEAVKTIKSKSSTRVEYGDIKDLDAFVKEFEKEATTVLLEFAAQMPKGTFAEVSNEAGFAEGKFLGGLACKAGLWWAKEQKEPVYYCLDGINMDDVTNHKKMKNAEIDDFLAGRSKKKHDEVITMVEVREILKNWKDLKYINDKGNEEDVVKFVLKGKILSGDDLKEKIKKWQEDMEAVNKAHPTPAPDYKTFTKQLNNIDPNLLAKLGNEKDAKKANRDAREIVKKYGYFVKIARTKPHIALKYIMSKCQKLIDYGLISKDLPDAATALKDAFDAKNQEGIKTAAKDLRSEIEKCHKDFQTPLEAALLRDPVTLKPI